MRLTLTEPHSVLEKAYDLESSQDEWVEGITVALAPMMQVGAGMLGGLLHAREEARIPVLEPLCSPDREVDVFFEAFGVRRRGRGPLEMDLDRFEAVFPAGGKFAGNAGLGTRAQIMRNARNVGDQHLARLAPLLFRDGYEDLAFMVAVDQETRTVLSFHARASERIEVTRQAQQRWRGLQRHLTAILRTRLRFARGDFEEESAIWLRPDGTCEGGSDLARDDDIRQRLRHAVRTREKNRLGRTRSQRATIRAYWQKVLSGQWALVDRFDSDGRRFIVAVPVDERPNAMLGLTRREREVFKLLAEGLSNKVVAHELGISTSAVSTHLNNIFRKLRIEDRASAVRDAQALRDVDD
jgi:DNA-binding CsgD family transcriptional regulator